MLVARSTEVPVVNLPPPVGPPADSLKWRPLIVNWFGSLFFIGLLAPMIVWSVVYCIRARRPKKRAKNQNAARSKTSLLKSVKSAASWPKPDSPTEIAKEIEPIQGWNAMAAGLRAPKSRMSKRDHFARYLGWWSTSVDHGDKPRRKTKSRSEDTAYIPRPWRMIQLGQVSKENLAERGQVGTALQSIEEEIGQPSQDSPQALKSPPGGGDAVVSSTGMSRENLHYMMSGALESGGDSGNNTVRRRPVNREKSNMWAALTSQLSRTATQRQLISDREPNQPGLRQGEMEGNLAKRLLDGDFRGHENETTLAITPPSKDSNEVHGTQVIQYQLRRIHSSPALNTSCFDAKPPGAILSTSSSYFAKIPDAQFHQLAAPLTLTSFRNQFDGTSEHQGAEGRGSHHTAVAVSNPCQPTMAHPSQQRSSVPSTGPSPQYYPRREKAPATLTLTVTKHRKRKRNRTKQSDPELGLSKTAPAIQGPRDLGSANRPAFSFDSGITSMIDIPAWAMRKFRREPEEIDVDLEKAVDDTNTLASYEKQDRDLDDHIALWQGSGSSAYSMSASRLMNFQRRGEMGGEAYGDGPAVNPETGEEESSKIVVVPRVEEELICDDIGNSHGGRRRLREHLRSNSTTDDGLGSFELEVKITPRMREPTGEAGGADGAV